MINPPNNHFREYNFTNGPMHYVGTACAFTAVISFVGAGIFRLINEAASYDVIPQKVINGLVITLGASCVTFVGLGCFQAYKIACSRPPVDLPSVNQV